MTGRDFRRYNEGEEGEWSRHTEKRTKSKRLREWLTRRIQRLS